MVLGSSFLRHMKESHHDVDQPFHSYHQIYHPPTSVRAHPNTRPPPWMPAFQSRVRDTLGIHCSEPAYIISPQARSYPITRPDTAAAHPHSRVVPDRAPRTDSCPSQARTRGQISQATCAHFARTPTIQLRSSHFQSRKPKCGG